MTIGQNNNIRAAFVPATVDNEKRTVELTFATDTPVERTIYQRGERVKILEVLGFGDTEINLERLNNGAPLLDNHSWWGGVSYGALGVVERAWVEGGQGHAVVRFSKREKAQEVFEDVKDGILRNISVGYSVKKFEKKKGEEIDTYRAVDWTPYELSIVLVPADNKAKIRAEETQVFDAEIEDAIPDYSVREYELNLLKF